MTYRSTAKGRQVWVWKPIVFTFAEGLSAEPEKHYGSIRSLRRQALAAPLFFDAMVGVQSG